MSDADLLARIASGDPDRYLAAMAGPAAARGPLLTLTAFNLEVGRAAWASREPLIARMRLQFWRDAIDRLENPPGHELAEPLAELILTKGLPVALFLRIIEAREADLLPRPFKGTAALWSYLEDTAGSLMELSILALGGVPDSRSREFGVLQGLANYLSAVPGLVAAGRDPLPDDSLEAITDLAGEGLLRWEYALRTRNTLARKARPALLQSWRARSLLGQASAHPERVLDGSLGHSEFERRGSLLWRSLVGF